MFQKNKIFQTKIKGYLFILFWNIIFLFILFQILLFFKILLSPMDMFRPLLVHRLGGPEIHGLCIHLGPTRGSERIPQNCRVPLLLSLGRRTRPPTATMGGEGKSRKRRSSPSSGTRRSLSSPLSRSNASSSSLGCFRGGRGEGGTEEAGQEG